MHMAMRDHVVIPGSIDSLHASVEVMLTYVMESGVV